ncbi:MAG: acetylhydrolase [Verrucomicrobiae bacterium]|nr:acetylhydrolase [Verrucomicrobiae bacterium]
MRPFLLSLILLGHLVPLAQGETPATIEVLRYEPVDASRARTVPVKIYRVKSAEARPVIVFSHGLGGSRENSAYLAEHWARHSYVAVFVQHPGSDESVWKEAGRGERFAAMKEAASGRSLLDRLGDIPFVLDQLERWNADSAHPLHGALDLEHIGMTGHSFGAVTTQAMMGQHYPLGKSFPDPRLDAFLPMSPSTGRGVPAATAFGQIQAPVLCMTGTEDTSVITPETTAASRREVYASMPKGDKYQLVFEGGTHSAFSDTALLKEKRFEHHHGAIQTISTRFWDAYLKGDAAAKAWLRSDKPRTDAKLLPKDVWEWK